MNYVAHQEKKNYKKQVEAEKNAPKPQPATIETAEGIHKQSHVFKHM
jgi:hypothetical protein